MCLSGAMYEQDMEEELNDDVVKRQHEELYDRCVVTGELTPYLKTDHIDTRMFYVEGVGQLSEKAWRDIYDK
jgi:hypothetical protein